MTHDVQLIWDLKAQLGEGPAWFSCEAALRFVDIKGGRLHSFKPTTGAKETLEIGGLPSFILPADNGQIITGSRDQIVALNQAGQLGETLAVIPMPAHNRTNDATVDAQGRLWLGTMDNDEQLPTGALWCYESGRLHRMGGDAVVTNGPAISRDGRTLYHVDSGARTIWRLAIGEVPQVEAREVFLQLTEADGHPDGVVLDSEGCLWVALWDGWSVRRYSPAGELMLSVQLPCARVTKIAFGGPDLKTAYVTSARTGLSADQLGNQPLAGALFAFEAPTSGVALPAIAMPASHAI